MNISLNKGNCTTFDRKSQAKFCKVIVLQSKQNITKHKQNIN